MKINSTLIKIFASILLVVAPLSFLAKTSYKGQVVYNNKNQTPLKGVEVVLKNLDGTVVATQYTDEKGKYKFEDIEESVYVLDADYDAEPGGVDIRDLFLIVKHLWGIKNLEGISYVASDVDGSGKIDWNDYWDFLVGWLINGRDFKAGKWVFQERTIDLNGTEMKVGNGDLMLSTGDGDGGYEPGVKNSPVGVELSSLGVIPVSKDNFYEIPVHYTGQKSIGGMSLVFNYSEDVIIEAVSSQIDNLNYSFEDGSLRISWLNTNNGINVIDNNKPLFTIKTRLANELIEASIFSLNNESQLINLEGLTIHDTSLTMPIIESELEAPELKDIYPNPVRDNAKIEYKLVHDSDVILSIFNTNGQKITELVNTVQSAGEYQIEFNVNNFNLSSGMYVYRLDCSGGQVFSDSKMLIVSK